ncbi:MAG: ATP-binding protein [Deltaproteobacteria bacterium]|nr:ATP-binding protein [Deltaproteobacteria bacterium]
MAFITGPRQVGKTTLAQSFLNPEQEGYFNWDNATQQKNILKNPDTFWKEPKILSRIVLDEIHKYPRWKRFLKGFYDLNRNNVEILVTGSGRLDIYQRGGDSLLGRYNQFHLAPFSLGELAGSYKQDLAPQNCIQKILDISKAKYKNELEQLWHFGGFPDPLFKAEDLYLGRWQNDYRRLILREDLRDLSHIREIGLIEQMLLLLPERIGSPLSLNSLREDLDVNIRSVQNWISTLEKLFLLFSISPYFKKIARSLKQQKKIYFYDWSSLENEGSKFENLIATHLLKACQYWTDMGYGIFQLHYVRNKEKKECDFLITKNQKPFLLVEAKFAEKQLDSSLPYFHKILATPYAFQVFYDANSYLLETGEKGLYLCSANRFLQALP